MDGFRLGVGFVQVSIQSIWGREIYKISFFFQGKNSTHHFFPHYNPILFKVIAPVFGAVVVLMILVEFCCEICCWSLFRSLFLSGAEISQAFTFVLCKKDVSWSYYWWFFNLISSSMFFILITVVCVDGSPAWWVDGHILEEFYHSVWTWF